MLQSIKNRTVSDVTGNYFMARIKTAFYAVLSFILAIPNSVVYCLLFVSLIVLEYYNFHLNTDTAIQLHTLKNFVSGHGITITSLDQNNSIVYNPCSLWPAGLVVLLAPVYLLTNSTVISLLILKIISFVFFILFVSRYLNYLQLKEYQKKFVIFFFMISVAPFVEFYVSDMIATTICLWSFYYYIQYLDNEKTGYLLLSLFLVAFCYFIKYSFLPFLFYPAVSFILKEKLKVFKRINRFLIIVFSTAFMGLFFYLLNLWLVGPAQMATRWDAFTGHAHWSQLSHFVGFLFTFGIYEWFFQNMIRKIFDVSILFNWISLLVTFYFFWLLLKSFFGRRKYNKDTGLLNSINISLASGGLILFFLCVLTINNPGQTWTTPYWTFVEETRYYGPVIIIALINVLVLFLIKKKGLLLHIIIPLMMLLNVFAYRTVIQSGFWGKNYRSYSLMKNNISAQMELNSPLKRSIVYFDKGTKNSDYYYYLQANGIVLMEKDKMKLNAKPLFADYILEKDSTDSFQIIKVN